MATDQSVQGSSPGGTELDNSEEEAATSMQAKTSSSSGGIGGEERYFSFRFLVPRLISYLRYILKQLMVLTKPKEIFYKGTQFMNFLVLSGVGSSF